MERLFTLKTMGETARWVWEQASGHPVLAFHGPMGAGKTTFIHALCDARHIREAVASPTFSIINEYRTPDPVNPATIYHIDLYRLNNEDEAIQAGVEDCLYSGHLCLVEWPEKAPGIFPESTLHIYIEAVSPDTRKLIIKGN